MKKKEFGEFLKNRRTELGLRIRDIEKLSDVSNSYVSQVEIGRRSIPTPAILKKFSAAYQIPYEELMERAGYIEHPAVPEAETFKMDKSELPPELSDLGVDYLIVTRKLKEAGITPDEMEKLVDFVRQLKKN